MTTASKTTTTIIKKASWSRVSPRTRFTRAEIIAVARAVYRVLAIKECDESMRARPWKAIDIAISVTNHASENPEEAWVSGSYLALSGIPVRVNHR